MHLGTGQIRQLFFSFSRLASFEKFGALFTHNHGQTILRLITNGQYEPQTPWCGIVRFVASFADYVRFSWRATGADGWQHQSHTRWPQVVAVVQNCSVEHPRASYRSLRFRAVFLLGGRLPDHLDFSLNRTIRRHGYGNSWGVPKP